MAEDVAENEKLYQAFAAKPELNNPIRLTNSTREYNIKEILGEDKQVVEIDIKSGNIYIHWEEKDTQCCVGESLLSSGEKVGKGGRK